jgi:predicted nuclease of predicted toxin-antitoxin system
VGITDPEVLAIAARDTRILVSHDRETMPAHFRRFIVESTSAGLLIVSQNRDIREAIEQILLVWAVSEDDEWTIGWAIFRCR